MTFTQLTSDFSRPGAGANQWNNQNVVAITGKRLDAYYRFTWLQFQPANGSDGVFDFTALDQQFQAAIDAGQKISFGIMQQCGGCDSNLQTHIVDPVTTKSASLIYPTWLHTKMQSESVKDYSIDGEWFPNYNSASWLKAWKDLNVATNAHIMSTSYKGIRYQDAIFEIDVRGYGDFGEWTNNDFSGPAGSQATTATLQAIIDATVQSYPTFQCVAMQATFDGGQLGNTNNPPVVGYYALTTSNTKGKLGWRRDSWGTVDNYNDQWTDTNPTVYNNLVFKTEIMTRYKIAPIVGEPEDGEGFAQLVNQVNTFHVASFGNGNIPNSGGTSATITAFQNASKAAGFRLTLTGGSITSSTVVLNWSNTGAAPTYEQWNVIFQLRSGSTVVWTGTSSFKPYLFLPGTTSVTDTFDWSALNGTYDLYIIITDPTGFRKPMPLAITGVNADGSYLVQPSLIVSGTPVTPPPPPPPPPPPTIAANIFGTTAPAGALLNDGQALALGVKVRSTVAGFITGVRFYKQSGNTGTHIGQLYSSAGTLLATGTFTGETSTGWQTLTFSSPVAITANTTYVASYFSPTGNYSDTNRGLASAIVNGNLSALASGTDGANGLYIYTNTPAFPINTYALSNYWVDVTFTTNATPPPPPNVAPVARITGATDITLVKATASLSGTTSTDSDGTIASYLWTKLSGPAGDVITTPTASTTTVTGLTPGTFVYDLAVTDNSGAVSHASISITVHF